MRHGHENHLATLRPSHGSHSFEIPNLHCCRSIEDLGGFAHQLGGVDLGAGSNDFGLTNTLGLGGGRERFLEFLAELNVFDENGFNLRNRKK